MGTSQKKIKVKDFIESKEYTIRLAVKTTELAEVVITSNKTICNKQIYMTVDNFKTGWTKVDLTTYNIKVNQDFVVTVQWVESKMDKKENPITRIPVAISLFSKDCYARIASQDKWKKVGMNLSNYVTLSY